MNRTSVMATLADDRSTPGFIARLHAAGAESLRINSAFVEPEDISRIVGMVRSTVPSMTILMDTKGPEVRTGTLDCDVEVMEGSRYTFHSSGNGTLTVALDEFPEVERGALLLIDDGTLRFEVEEWTPSALITRALCQGILGSRKTVTMPGTDLPALPAVSERDRRNISAAVRCGIDMIAHSFVRSEADVKAVRELIAGTSVRLFAKIECAQALDNLDEILRAADGLLVARGDLGTAVPLWRIPLIQRRILLECRRAGKPSIVATQMLQSMMENPAPTRAEVNDAALAVMEGADCLLLTGETARGLYPEECVAMLRNVIDDVESNSLRCSIK